MPDKYGFSAGGGGGEGTFAEIGTRSKGPGMVDPGETSSTTADLLGGGVCPTSSGVGSLSPTSNSPLGWKNLSGALSLRADPRDNRLGTSIKGANRLSNPGPLFQLFPLLVLEPPAIAGTRPERFPSAIAPGLPRPGVLLPFDVVVLAPGAPAQDELPDEPALFFPPAIDREELDGAVDPPREELAEPRDRG